ncbi:protein turtle homolog B isoform X2 [Microcaecilia unicolor]|uniref:Protein turtle homolog B-like isoform X2 n=1 Tax=Microcaecilia unicolor TaxID=1415580 RepID=A0A6P7WTL2_9AMPH|nr:protein turtle homolog B-like isoform X2 [Microcaecilia unicolor]
MKKKLSRKFSLLVLILVTVASAQDSRYEVFQPELVSAVVGEAIILPCSFSYPREIEPIWDVRVYWRINNLHGGYIYKDMKDFIHPEYAGRLSLHGLPMVDKTASLRITGLRESDSNRYYCRVVMTMNDEGTEEMQNVNGTELRVSGSAQKPQYQVFQPELVSAVVGESVILPCYFTYPQEIKSNQGMNVSWRINNFHGDYIYNYGQRFTHSDYKGRISLSGFPWGDNTASVRISDLRKNDSNRYYCQVQLRKNDGKIQEVQSINGTELRVTDSAQKPQYQVFQPEMVLAVVGESVILPCSFTYPQEIEPIRDARVSWRMNSFRGDYIYKFIPSFTHRDYRRRISLTGFPWGNNTASIRISDLRKSDSKRYYCRVQLIKNDGVAEEVQSVDGTELRMMEEAPTVDIDDRTREANPGMDEEGRTKTANSDGDYHNY